MTRFDEFEERFHAMSDPTCRVEGDHGMPNVVDEAFAEFQVDLLTMLENGEVGALHITAMGMALAVKGLTAMEFCPACEIGHWVDNIHESVGCANEQ
ncbi:hypothetical protein LCGC14_0461800 [marine sediment metagenome]|uniref:Uncharacterized protein n=1 Tax=marine sediment metagenome TaxID=412755 RepID=A0A0F9SXT3_9ZZZZ